MHLFGYALEFKGSGGNKMSINKLFCSDWEFSLQPYGSGYSDDYNWSKVDIPHDWLIYDTKDLYKKSTGWYRKKFTYEKKNGMLAAVRFEGVYMDCTVYINGIAAGEWKYGYSTFEFDITSLLVDGDNTIAVKVNYNTPNSRWYSGAGIFRPVYFKEMPETHLVSDGVYISTEDIGGGKWNVTVTAEAVRPINAPLAGWSIRETVLSPDGDVLCTVQSDISAVDRSCIPASVACEGCSYAIGNHTVTVDNPCLWDIGKGVLYTVKTELMYKDEVIDTSLDTFGFRTIQFTADKGFFINGRNVKINGVCEHHDNGCLGAAINKNALARKLDKLSVMGVNAIRTSHNMPATELMTLADERGVLILSEGFDMWERPKTDNDYGNYFKQWVERDVASWVRRDRNHPSVIGWSVGNEIYDQHADERGQEVTSLLARLVRTHDNRCNGYVTFGSNYMEWENAQKCGDIVKLVGYNYGERLYNNHHEKHPDWMIYGSETASVVQSRGIYHFPYAQSVLADDDEQCSSLGNSTTGWGAKSPEWCIIQDRDAKFSAGQFIWTGFDYIGEPTPYSTKNSYFGQIDTAGFEKDSAFIFRSEWTDYKQSPCVHIFPHWDFNPGQPIDVRVTSNAPRVELFFNGKSMGAYDIDHEKGEKLTADYIIPYETGVLEAVAYDDKGNEIARDRTESFGDTAEIVLSPEKSEIKADGLDLAYIDISAADSEGRFVANANNRVFVEVSGAGRLVGLDNGDSTDYDQYKGTSRRLFSGKLLAVVASKKQAGDITVTVKSKGLPDSVCVIKSCAADCDEGVSALEENISMDFDASAGIDDVPVRKIELRAECLAFSENRKTIRVTPVIYPSNASYVKDIEYKITTVLGIPSNLGKCSLEEDGSILVAALGDGEFSLRAICKNGTDKYHIISSIPFTAEGIGTAVFNPYELVIGGLYSVSSGNIGNGIERGAAFAWGDSWLGYENVDFGMVGSDTVTVPIYANCTTPVKIAFYDGIPDDGGELIGEFTYHEPPQWLTYIPNTFKLTKKLKGVHTLCMRSGDGYQIGGFFFEKTDKAYAQLDTPSAESIYGDKFTVCEDAVVGIGNNVMLNFGEMDFGSTAPKRLIICGRSELPLNSIHCIVKGDSTARILCEFERAEEYTERSFDISGISGKCEVSFAFLPGSNFDYKYFRFEK